MNGKRSGVATVLFMIAVWLAAFSLAEPPNLNPVSGAIEEMAGVQKIVPSSNSKTRACNSLAGVGRRGLVGMPGGRLAVARLWRWRRAAARPGSRAGQGAGLRRWVFRVCSCRRSADVLRCSSEQGAPQASFGCQQLAACGLTALPGIGGIIGIKRNRHGAGGIWAVLRHTFAASEELENSEAGLPRTGLQRRMRHRI